MKISIEQANEIRVRTSRGEHQRDLALEYGITHQAVSQIVQLQTHIPEGSAKVTTLIPSTDLAILDYVALKLQVPVSMVVSQGLRILLDGMRDQPLDQIVARLTVAS